MVPVNLGVNPSLTITALAEYVLDQFPGKGSGMPDQGRARLVSPYS